MGGVRFARNSVHHQWSDAMRLNDRTRSYPRTYPLVYFEWRVWVPGDALPKPGKTPRPNHERIYREQMEGRPVRICLDVLNGAFYTLQRLLEPHTILKQSRATDYPFPAPEPSSSG